VTSGTFEVLIMLSLLSPRRVRSLLPTFGLSFALGCSASAVGDAPVVAAPDADESPDAGEDTRHGFPPIVDLCDAVSCPSDEVCQGAGQCVSAYADADRDGFNAAEDCDDFDPAINPNAAEVCDGRDNECNAVVDDGFDLDGDGFPTCRTARGAADCDDSSAEINPGATEVCDGRDNNCDGMVDEAFDADRDGFSGCDPNPANADCDDNDPAVHPGAPELCDAIDNNCDGTLNEGGVCVGCSDGARDDLVDQQRWPSVAACAGTFGRTSLRATRTGNPCGDDLGQGCSAPEDLCMPGWHICMRNGSAADLRFRLTAAECRNLPRTYVAATNNCANTSNPADSSCDMSEPFGCSPTGWCSAPVACGPHETSHCAHAVWPNETFIFGLHAGRTDGDGCSSISTNVTVDSIYFGHLSLSGVLCCRD
jgi:hypothetical protein